MIITAMLLASALFAQCSNYICESQSEECLTVLIQCRNVV